MHGLAIVAALGWRAYLPPLPRVVGWAATVSFVLLSAVVFRAATLDAAWHIFEGLSTLPDFARISGFKTLLVAASCAMLLPPTGDLCTRLIDRPRRAVATLLGVTSASILVLLGGNRSYDFIYFQF
jgi:hypothetical protein